MRRADRAAQAVGSVFIGGVQVLDRSGSFDGPLDVSVVDGRITEIGPNLTPLAGQLRLDGAGLWLLPGIFDCHLHTGLASYDTLELLNTPISRRVLQTAQVLRQTAESG